MTRTLITGPGRSGTTLLAHAMHEAGYRFGPSPKCHPKNIGTNSTPFGGMEHEGWHFLSRVVGDALEKKKDVAVVADSYAGEIAELVRTSPPAVKCPGIIRCWQVWDHLGALPERIIVCMRDILALERSFTHYRVGGDGCEARASQYDALASEMFRDLQDRDIRLVLYPHFARNEGYFDTMLGDVLDWGVMQRVFDERLVHF